MSPIRDARAITPAHDHPVLVRLLAVVVALGVVMPVSWSASSALAPARASTSSSSHAAIATPVKKAKVTPTATLRIAKAQKGKPYRRGSAGPTAFDCSGLVKYVMKKQHKKVPRTAQAQYKASKKVSKSHIKRGDLVFFNSGGHIYHVGIYAGHHKIWHAPKPGSRVKLATIWTSRWKAGRVVG
jgi:cell wall-associated NlpC family hydrolase